MSLASAKPNMMGGGFNPLSLLTGVGKIKELFGGLLGGGQATEEAQEQRRDNVRSMSQPNNNESFVDGITQAGKDAVDNVVNDATNVGKQFVTERAADAIFPVLKFLQLAKMVPGVEKTLIGALTKANLTEEESKLLLDKPHRIYDLIAEKGDTFIDKIKDSLFDLADNSFIGSIPGVSGLIQKYKGNDNSKVQSNNTKTNDNKKESSIKEKGIKGMLLAGLAFLRPAKLIATWKTASKTKKIGMGLGGIIVAPILIKLAYKAVSAVFNFMKWAFIGVGSFFLGKKFFGKKDEAAAEGGSNVVQMPQKGGGIWGFIKDKLHLGVHHATEMADKASGGVLSMTGMKDKLKNGVSNQLNKIAG